MNLKIAYIAFSLSDILGGEAVSSLSSTEPARDVQNLNWPLSCAAFSPLSLKWSSSRLKKNLVKNYNILWTLKDNRVNFKENKNDNIHKNEVQDIRW